MNKFPSSLTLLAVTLVTLVAFAANSILCRLALGTGAIDAASFSTIRLVSGALALTALLWGSRRSAQSLRCGTWVSGLMLFLYAIPFSFAYVSLSAGTGALILFASVQGTMMASGIRRGERPTAIQWGGLALAFAGLIYLLLPGLSAPSPLGSSSMTVAGIAWGIYSVRGRGEKDPLCVTAGNFVRAVPFAVAVSVVVLATAKVSAVGVLLAVISGAATSGIGYVAWYWALRGLTTTKAAIVQLAVPVLAALAGAAFLSEVITLRLALASILVVGGVAAAVLTRQHGTQRDS